MTVFEPGEFEFKLLCVRFLATHSAKIGDLDNFERMFGTRDITAILHALELKFRRLSGYMVESSDVLSDEQIRMIYDENYVKD